VRLQFEVVEEVHDEQLSRFDLCAVRTLRLQGGQEAIATPGLLDRL
jgi:hypothetical protein